MSGTSMAAPATTGMIALVLAEAKSRNKTLSTLDIRNIVINAARRNPPPGTGWDSRHGNGRISAGGAVAAVIGSAPPSPTRKPGAAKKMTARVAAKKRSKAAGSAAKRAKPGRAKTRK
jgi:subtilisin family serine protease